MTIKLLCIEPGEHYGLVDTQLLGSLGIEVIFVRKSGSTIADLGQNVFVNSFEYAELYAICELVRPDYMVSFSEYLFVDLAKIRNALGIKGMSLEKALLLSHKNRMYEQLCGSVQCPQTTTLSEALTFSALQKLLHCDEVFIKPINKAGSYETYHLKNEVDFQQFLIQQKEGLINYIAQNYIEADLYHSELVVCGGEVLYSSARKYSFPNHLMVSRSEPIFSLNISEPDFYKKIVDSSIKVQEALGVDNGILHTEFFMTELGEVTFIETNARAPGIGLNHLHKKKLSISLETLLCCIVCGVQPPKLIERDYQYLCGYYPLLPGRVKKVELPQLEVENEWIVYVKPGDVHDPATRMTKSAMVVCWDASSQKIEDVGNELANHQLVEIYKDDNFY